MPLHCREIALPFALLPRRSAEQLAGTVFFRGIDPYFDEIRATFIHRRVRRHDEATVFAEDLAHLLGLLSNFFRRPNLKQRDRETTGDTHYIPCRLLQFGDIGTLEVARRLSSHES